jgi:hypothetical protein
LGKCKSSINGALKLLGYATIVPRGDISPELVEALPNLRGKIRDLRQWSIRRPRNYTWPDIDLYPEEECPGENRESKGIADTGLEGYAESTEDLSIGKETNGSIGRESNADSGISYIDELRHLSDDEVRPWTYWEI